MLGQRSLSIRTNRRTLAIKHLLAMLRDDEGATMVEYGIMIALVAAVCIVLIGTLGKSVSTQFASVDSNL